MNELKTKAMTRPPMHKMIVPPAAPPLSASREVELKSTAPRPR